jgi:hypothetical protein
MTEAVAFKCHSCGAPYRVATAHAGRKFACKTCGTQLTVPTISALEAGVVPEVQMDSGAEVMRKTDSGRQVRADPTRVFSSRRNMVVPRPGGPAPVPEQPKKSSRVPLLIVLMALLGVATVGAAFALGVFDDSGTSATQVAENGDEQPVTNSGPSERDRILNQLTSPGITGPAIYDLLGQARKAELATADLIEISRRLANNVRDTDGQGFTEAQLIQIGDELRDLALSREASWMFDVVVKRHMDVTPQSEEFQQAQDRLGRTYVDFGPIMEAADDLVATGVVEGATELAAAVRDLESRSSRGWVTPGLGIELEELKEKITTSQTELERIKREDPFQLVTARTTNQMRLERFWGRGEFIVVGREPFIIVMQVPPRESIARLESLLDTPLAAVAAFNEFYQREVAEPAGLERRLPAELNEQERQAHPYVVVLFNEASAWRGYLSNVRSTISAGDAQLFVEHDRTRASLTYSVDQVTNRVVLAGLRLILDSHAPAAPTSRQLDGEFEPVQSFMLRAALLRCMFRHQVSAGDYTFMQLDEGMVARLHTWRQPFQAQDGNVRSFGGPGFLARDIVHATDADELVETFLAKLPGYGWPENIQQGVARAMQPGQNVRANVLNSYLDGFLMFLWHYTGNARTPRYREPFLQFMKAEMSGEVTRENAAQKFEEIFELDAAGWQRLERDFLDFQSN